MVPEFSPCAPGRRLGAFVGALALLSVLTPCTHAADLDKADTALKILPADAAFFSSSLRIKEQVEIVGKSRAWAKLWNLPAVQQAWKMAQNEYKAGGQLAPIHDFFAQPENKELLALLADAGSHEIFFYGGDSWAGFLQLLQGTYGAARLAPLEALVEGNPFGRDPNEMQARAALRFLTRNPQLLNVPDLVIGCKLTDAARAAKQIKRLEGLLGALAAQMPQLKGRVQTAKINDGTFLTLVLDGTMVPWDAIPWKDVEEKPGEFAPLVRQLKARTVTVSLGVQQDYLLFSIGGTTAQLAKIGGRGPRLSSRPELKPLAQYADRKLTSIGYVSKDLVARASAGQDYDRLLDLAKAGLPKSPLPEEQQKRLLRDLTEFAKEMKDDPSRFGALVDFSFLTERGYTGYSYNYGKDESLDGSKPLTLLNHVGGNPLLAVVGRSKVTGENYKMLARWVKIVYGHLDEIARANLQGNDRDEYVKFTGQLVPLAQRLDKNTATNLIPALADGQGAFVLDAKWSSKQWLQAVPATEKPLPMLEIGIVLGVSDADKLRKAAGEYLSIADDALVAARSLGNVAGAIGDFRLPKPETAKRPAGTLYFYKLPDDLGLDRAVAPTAGLSDKVAALTLSHAHAERLLASKPLAVDGGPLADPKKPLAGAFYCNWPAFVDAVTPWLELAAPQVWPGPEREQFMPQVRTVLQVLKVYRGTTSATYLKDGVIVTERETVIKDLDK
jgi:hypothetical protein